MTIIKINYMGLRPSIRECIRKKGAKKERNIEYEMIENIDINCQSQRKLVAQKVLDLKRKHNHRIINIS